MAETLFFINLEKNGINMIDNIPTYSRAPTSQVSRTDCVELTLHFLNIITDNQLNQMQGCHKIGTDRSIIKNLFNARHPNYVYSERNVPFKFLVDNLPVNTATFGGLLRPQAGGHAVLFVKDGMNNIYLVDVQQNIKLQNADIYKYLDYLKVENQVVMVYFAYKKNLSYKPNIPEIFGGKKKHTKNKSRKNKSRKNKSQKNKLRKNKKR